MRLTEACHFILGKEVKHGEHSAKPVRPEVVQSPEGERENEHMRTCLNTHWVSNKNVQYLKFFAVPAAPQEYFLRGMFTVVERRL